MPEDRTAPAPTFGRKACPICGKPAQDTAAPFCSKRCADVDLHRWLGGVYALPAGESDHADSLGDDSET